MFQRLLLYLIFLLPAGLAAQVSTSAFIGTVTNEKGEPIPGIIVQLQDTRIGAVTNEAGYFEIKQVEPGTYKALISSIGYAKQTQPITLLAGKTLELNIKMVEDVQSLDEVEITGNSETREKMSQPIKVEAMDLSGIQARSTPVTQLINQMPGVNIRQSTGVGSAVTVNLNGLQGNAIRYFLDGIPLDYLGRAFDLSIVPIGQLSGVEVYKGILPATLGADALGGAVNLISAALEETQLDVSYSLGSFNTHQANLNAYVAVPKTKLYLKLTSYYIHADNNYPMEVMVVDSVTQNLVPASVRRFHDRVSSGFAQISAGVKDTRWADQFEIGYAYFDYQKDEQHGFNIAEPFGEVVSYENFGAIHGRYRKQFGKLDIDLFGAFNQKNQRFVDTTRLRYGWDGEVTNVTNGNQGESAEKSLQSLEFQTWVARANLSYQLGPATISLIHNANMERRVGEDPFGLVSIGGEFIDPLHQPATYDKHITGLQLTIPYWNGRITQVFTAKRYYLNTTTYESWRDSTLEVDHLSYGLGTSLKYTLGANRFIRASYEHATRIPGSQEYFGDGIFLLGNPFLEPERSHNVNLGFYTNLDHKNRWWLDVNAFYRDVDDQILQQAIWLIFSQYRNKDGSRVMGIETSLKTTFFNRLQVSANVTLQDARRINITDVQQQGMEGARLPFQPFFYTNLNVNYSIPNLLGQGALLSLYGSYAFTEKYIFIQIPREHEPAIFSNVANSPLSNLGDFIIPTQHLVNAGASYKFGKLPLWINLEVNNALNLEIYDNFRVPRQPINLMAKIRYKFH